MIKEQRKKFRASLNIELSGKIINLRKKQSGTNLDSRNLDFVQDRAITKSWLDRQISRHRNPNSPKEAIQSCISFTKFTKLKKKTILSRNKFPPIKSQFDHGVVMNLEDRDCETP